MELVSRFFDIPNQSCFLLGPLGTGKSTWLRHRLPDALFLDLLEPALHRSLNARPERLRELLAGSPRIDTVVIDEIQRIPELLTVVHALMEEPSPPRFVLTGSSARKLRRGGADLLGGTGRTPHHAPLHGSGVVRLRPRTSTANWVATPGHGSHRPCGRPERLREPLSRTGGTGRRADAERRELHPISGSGQLLPRRTTQHIGGGQECEVERKVVAGYIGILEDLLLAFRLPVFRKRAKRAIVNHEKIYLFDTGVFRSLRPKGPLDRPEEIDGQALEGLVAQHLRAWAAYSRHHADLFFWRTRAGTEVDFVVYGEPGLQAFEVKIPAGSSPPTSALSGHFATTIPRQRPPCSIAAGTGCGSTTSGVCRSRTSFAGPHRTRVCWPGCEERFRVATVETAGLFHASVRGSKST